MANIRFQELKQMTWNAPGEAVPIVLDCVNKAGFKISQVQFRVVAGKTKVFSIPSWKYNFNQESTNLGEFQYTLGQKVYNLDSPKFGYL